MKYVLILVLVVTLAACDRNNASPQTSTSLFGATRINQSDLATDSTPLPIPHQPLPIVPSIRNEHELVVLMYDDGTIAARHATPANDRQL